MAIATAPRVVAKPFVRGAFEALPEVAHQPHRFFDTEGIELELHDSPLGPMRVHVRKHGEGPPLLLVHGLMTSSYSWRYVYGPLGERFTCYAPDLPGNGRTPASLDVPYHPQTLARWLGAVQNALGIRGCPVIGNSMGGYLCCWWALEDAGAMSRLLNLHSPGIPELRIRALHTVLKVPGSHALLRYLIHRDPLRWVHRNVHYYDESLKSREEAHEYGEPLRTHEGAQCLVKYLGETMAPGPMVELAELMRARGGAFPVPLWLLYATQDPMVPPRFGHAFKAMIPAAQLTWLERASHFAHVDAPERFLQAAEPFLKGA